MKQFMRYTAAAALLASLGACVVAPPQPVGVRMSSATLPTYNAYGQYVGMMPSNYVPPATPVAQAAPAAPAAPVAQAAPAAQPAAPMQQAAPAVQAAPVAQAAPPAPVYLQSTSPSVIYVQAPQPVYTYSYPAYYPYGYPAFYPCCVGPWFGGIGLGIGFRVHIR